MRSATEVLSRLNADGIDSGKQPIELLPDGSEAHFEYAVALRHKMIQVTKSKAMFVIGDYKAELRRAIELDPKNVRVKKAVGVEHGQSYVIQDPETETKCHEPNRAACTQQS
jgi:hypothetical protein